MQFSWKDCSLRTRQTFKEAYMRKETTSDAISATTQASKLSTGNSSSRCAACQLPDLAGSDSSSDDQSHEDAA
jgi:hypothetical protein